MSSKTKAKSKKPTKSKNTPAPKKAKSAKPKAAKPAQKAKAEEGETKLDKVIKLLSRKEGASIQDLVDATEWQPHTVRSALSHALAKKRGYKIVSSKEKGGKRIYKIETPANE